jgi:hypothetical protein
MSPYLKDSVTLATFIFAILILFGVAILLDYAIWLRKAILRLSIGRIQQTGFTIYQLRGDFIMAITGIVAGATGVFQETPLPIGAVIPAGTIPKWSTSDTTNTSLTPSADGTQCAVAVAAGATIPSFVLTVSNQDGSFPTPVTVPVLQPAPPPQTGFVINQLS